MCRQELADQGCFVGTSTISSAPLRARLSAAGRVRGKGRHAMIRLLRGPLAGGSAPKPPDFPFFSARMGIFALRSLGAAVVLPPRGHSGRDTGRSSCFPPEIYPFRCRWGHYQPRRSRLQRKAANGNSPLNFVSHLWGSPHHGVPFPPRAPRPVLSCSHRSDPSRRTRPAQALPNPSCPSRIDAGGFLSSP